MLSRDAVRASIASTSRKSRLSVVTVSACHFCPPSVVRNTVLPLPLAQATVSLTALTPRSVAATPLVCTVHRGAATRPDSTAPASSTVMIHFETIRPASLPRERGDQAVLKLQPFI